MFAVTLSSGTEYHAARLSIGAGPVPAARGSMDMAGSSSSSERGYVAEMHVGTLHVDALDAHAHMGGGGSWAGHAIPASFFLIWGSYWALSAIAAVAAAGATRTPFRVRAWYPFLPRTLPRAWSRLRRLEPILKVALPSFGAFCELYFHPKFGGSRGGSQFNGMHNPDGTFNEGHAKFWQHACMYGFFILSGAVDLRDARLLPPMSGHAVLSGAFFAEAFLFYFHLQSQSGMLQEIHLLLVYAIVMCGVATAAEALTGSGVAALARGAPAESQGVRPAAMAQLTRGRAPAQRTSRCCRAPGLRKSRTPFTARPCCWCLCNAARPPSNLTSPLCRAGKKPWVEDMATEMMMPVYFCLHLLLWAGALLTLNGLWARYEHGTVLAARGGALWQTLEAAALAGSANGAGDSCAPSSV